MNQECEKHIFCDKCFIEKTNEKHEMLSPDWETIEISGVIDVTENLTLNKITWK